MKKSEVLKIKKECEQKLEKMKERKLIKKGNLQLDTLHRKVHAWIERKDGYAININCIKSTEDFVKRAKEFCTNK